MSSKAPAVTDLDTEGEAAAVPKKKSKLLLIVLALVLLAGGGAGAFFFLHGRKKPAKAAEPAVVLSPTPVYLPMEPHFIVNFQDKGSIRYLQVDVQVMSHDAQALDELKNEDPRARNALVMLFSGQTFENLASRDGKLKLQQQSLAELQKIVAEHLHRPGIEAVYFTNFVMQ